MNASAHQRLGDHQDVAAQARDGGAHVSVVDAAAEAAILAAVLTNPDTLAEVDTVVTPEDFGVPAHTEIFRAVLACDGQGRAFDTVTVADELDRSGQLGRIGGVETLDRIVATSGGGMHLESYVGIIVDRSVRRRLISASRAIATRSMAGEDEADALVDFAEAHMHAATTGRGASSSLHPMTDIMAKVSAQMSNARGAMLLGAPTGYVQLDEVTAGLQPGQLIVVAARPAMGKSAWVLQLARHICDATSTTVPVLSYEMSAVELGFRLMSAATGIGMGRLQRGQIPQGSDRTVAVEAEKLAASTLLIDDRPPGTVGGIRSAMRRLSRRTQLGAIVVDYLQLVKGNGRRAEENRTAEVSDVTRELKLMASELEVPVIAVSQLSRALENRPNKRPQLSDLRDSGSIEQDANSVLFLYRDAVYNPSSPDSEAELIVAKNRNGPSGVTVPLRWDSSAVRFADPSGSRARLHDPSWPY